MSFGRYEPRVHTGTPIERARGLLQEYWDIMSWVMMRMHAQDREMNRIQDELEGQMGYVLWHDNDSDGDCVGVYITDASFVHVGPSCKGASSPETCDCDKSGVDLKTAVVAYVGDDT